MSDVQKKPDFAAVKRLARKVLEENFVIEPPVIAADLAASHGLEVMSSELSRTIIILRGSLILIRSRYMLTPMTVSSVRISR